MQIRLGLKLNAAKANRVYISLGSNIQPEIHIPAAVKWLDERFELLAYSSVYQSPALGTAGPDFLNAAALIETQHSADALKNTYFRPYEASTGRVRSADKNAPRPIDIDILIYNNHLVELELWDQAHLAVPLAQIFPDLRHPDGRSLQDISLQLQSAGTVRQRRDILIR